MTVATDGLRIVSIETTKVRVPLATTFRGSYYRMTHRSTILTRITADEGVVGEAYVGDEDTSLDEIESIVHDEIAPQLLGEDALCVERCREKARPATFDILRDRRLGLVACACVETALWDAVGKHLEVPLWKLWGGFRRSLPIIAIGGYYGMELDPQVESIVDLGVAGMKLKVGGASPDEDAKRFHRTREIGGESFLLGADANQGWTTAEAIRFARLVEDDRLDWFEEPCHWTNDRLAMRDVRFVAGARITAGQSELSAAACRDLMAAGAIDVCNFDASWSGGPSEWREAAAIAHAYNVDMGHHEEPQVASHLLASIPHGVFVECFTPERDPIWWNLVANRPELENGELRLLDTPGLGWVIDEEYLAHYRLGTARISQAATVAG